MIIYLPLAIALAGLLMFGYAANPKVNTIGLHMFWVGLLAWLLTGGQPLIHILGKP